MTDEWGEVAELSAAMAAHNAKVILAPVSGRAAMLVREDPLRAGYLTAPARVFTTLVDWREGLSLHLLVEFQATPSVHIDGYLPVRHPATQDIMACLKAQDGFRVYFLAPGETNPYTTVDLHWTETERRYVSELQVCAEQSLYLAGLAIAEKKAWGPPENLPALVFLPPAGKAAPLPTATMLMHNANWNTVVQSDAGPDTRAVAALLPGKSILSFLWPKKMDPLAALRFVVEYEVDQGRVVPWPLVGAIYTVLQARRAGLDKTLWNIPLRMILGVVPDAPLAAVPAPSRDEIRAQARQWPGHLTQAPRNPYALACYLWEVGKLAWTPTGPTHNAVVTGSLALMVEFVQPQPWEAEIPNAGSIRAGDNHPLTVGLLWDYFLVLCSAPLSSEVLTWLLPGRVVPPLGDLPIEEAIFKNSKDETGRALPLPTDQNLLVAWADSLTAQAQVPDRDRDQYAPIGPFRVPLAANTLLAAWGVAELRIWLETTGLWASMVAPDQRVVGVLRWEPTGIPGNGFFMVPRWATPTMQLFLSGLWLDMHRAGPPSFPVQTPARPRRHRRGSRHPASPPATPAVHSVPYRRRVQVWSLTGERRSWGTSQEQTSARHPTTSHYVRGHLRLWVYETEWQAVPLQAALPQPPVEDWKKRLLLSWGRGAPEHAAWWTTLIDAATKAQRLDSEAARLTVVDQALASLAAKHPGTQIERWVAAGQEALTQARERGCGPLLQEILPSLTALRQEAIIRARASRLAAPPVGMTVVRPYLVRGAGTPADNAPTVVPEGLAVVAALLSLDSATPASPATRIQEGVRRELPPTTPATATEEAR